MLGNPKEAKEEIDPVEENLCKHIEQEKKLWVLFNECFLMICYTQYFRSDSEDPAQID